MSGSSTGKSSGAENPEYADIEQEIGAAAGLVNRAYGEPDRTPIRYVNCAYGHATCARYAVAGRPESRSQRADPFAFRWRGSGVQSALLVGPYDPNRVAAALGQAGAFNSFGKRRERHTQCSARLPGTT